MLSPQPAEGEAEPSAAQKSIKLLLPLREGRCPHNNSPETTTDDIFNRMSHTDSPALHCAQAKLTVKSKDKKLDVFFWSWIMAMVATLNFYLNTELSYLWQESSTLAAKAMGHGVNYAQNLQKWIKNYLHSEKLPLHHCGTYRSSILEDKDFWRDIQLHLTEIAKKGYIHAQDIVDYVATAEVQQKLGAKAHGIHVQTELAVSAEEKGHVYQWTWAQKCGGISEMVHWMLEGIQKALCHLWKWWKWSFNTYWIRCPTRCVLLVDSGNSWWVHILWKWPLQNPLDFQICKGSCREKGRGAVNHGVWISTSKWGWLVHGEE